MFRRLPAPRGSHPWTTGFLRATERRKVESFSLLRIILLSDIGIAGIRRRDIPGKILFHYSRPFGFKAREIFS